LLGELKRQACTHDPCPDYDYMHRDPPCVAFLPP
jgi:hypothetical protein